MGETEWVRKRYHLKHFFFLPVTPEITWSVRTPRTTLRFWISEGLTQAESQFQGVEFSCPWGTSQDAEDKIAQARKRAEEGALDALSAAKKDGRAGSESEPG